MKNTYFYICVGIIFLSFVPYSTSVAQSVSDHANTAYSCDLQPLGLFRQDTGARWKKSEGFHETWVVDDDSDIKEGRWGISELGQIDPTYLFYLVRNPSVPANEKCDSVIEVLGKLISPNGKLFDFKEARYDISLRKLAFKTIERDGLSYYGEVQFLAKPIFLRGIYQSGTAKLTASSRSLGIISIEFPFTSWNSE